MSGVLYITIVSTIAENTQARYIYSIYPIIIVLFIVIIDRILSHIFKVKNAPVDKQNFISKNKTLVFLIIFIVIFGFYNKKQYLEYFYPIDTAEIASMSPLLNLLSYRLMTAGFLQILLFLLRKIIRRVM